MKTTYPAPGILEGVTTAAEARAALNVPAASSSIPNEVAVYPEIKDDGVNVVIRHTDGTSGNIFQIKGDKDAGIRYEKCINGAWTTIPTAVARGGTGATTAANALTNLGATLKINSQAFSNISINANAGLATQTVAATTISGYTPVAIAGFQMSALTVVPVSCYLDGTNIKYALRNVTSSAVSGITFTVRVLYAGTNMKK